MYPHNLLTGVLFQSWKKHTVSKETEMESDRKQGQVALFKVTSHSTLLFVETPKCALHLTSSHLEPLIHVQLAWLVLLNKYDDGQSWLSIVSL